ncbi:MAG: phosphoribosylformylglycinamidine synthase [Pseudomonadota bacterium]
MTARPDRSRTATLHLIAGGPAITEFRRQALLARCSRRGLRIDDISLRDVWLVYGEALSGEEQSSLLQLLNQGTAFDATDLDAGFFVAPRVGTISPWSSKATDIAHQCGLAGIQRIERARLIHASGADRDAAALREICFDRMTEQAFTDRHALAEIFDQQLPRPLQQVALGDKPDNALQDANTRLGLALSTAEVDWLAAHYSEAGRSPTDAELMMFAQANSEHCRHKIFNAAWTLDEKVQSATLFGMIRHTTAQSPDGVVSAYTDNAAVLAGHTVPRLTVDPASQRFAYQPQQVDLLAKVETHNHPTAISPFPGAATGAGGEIRDEGATGLGAVPKAGLTGFTVSDLCLRDFPQAWEDDIGRPDRIVSALDIMLEGPIGGAAFNNEFGRPNLGGYFRTFQATRNEPGEHWGYHKPIMIAGGVGNVQRQHALKQPLQPGSLVVVLGGPAMLIGLGGGAASSVASGSSDAALDFASVQRGNPEMQRRAQEVITQCAAMGDTNPIALIHDVGAGGLSNAVPEACDHSKLGGRFELRNIPSDEPGMSPMEIWCNESQERYVLVIEPEQLERFEALCQRERCPYAVLGTLRADDRLLLSDAWSDAAPVDMPMSVLLGKAPRMQRDATTVAPDYKPFAAGDIDLRDAWRRVLSLPSVADKSFLIHIGDRTVGGLCARDQLVGRWQVPVSDVAVTLTSHQGFAGEAMAMGERTPVACEAPVAAARLAVAEAVLNIAAADIQSISDIKLSANWMAAAGADGQDAALFAAVEEVGMRLCPALGIAVPVGKDSLSMQTRWQDNETDRRVMSPVSLIVSAFAPVQDARRTLTPALADVADSQLLFVDLAASTAALGRSALAQTYAQQGGEPADLSDADDLRRFVQAFIGLRARGAVLAYHDRSDGGLLTTLAEMLFASRLGVRVHLPQDEHTDHAWLFSEGPGAVLQIADGDIETVTQAFGDAGLAERLIWLGGLQPDERLTIRREDRIVLDESRIDLQLCWSQTSFRMQAERDNPVTAAEAYENIARADDRGLFADLSFDRQADIAAPMINRGVAPQVAILREQGVNSQQEMAAAFLAAGFDARDVHMSDLIAGRVSLDAFQVLAACGGFSYGDVLGAGGGWAKSILMNPALRDQFARFFALPDSLTLGVCNGCQMLSQLKEIIPGAAAWPGFAANRSAQFEARLSMVEIVTGRSPWLAGMAGSRMPIVTSHGEGRADYSQLGSLAQSEQLELIASRFIDDRGQPTAHYPENPNGSTAAIAALINEDGRVLISMPHPERIIRTVQHSWHPPSWTTDEGPWLRLFRNARVALG